MTCLFGVLRAKPAAVRVDELGDRGEGAPANEHRRSPRWASASVRSPECRGRGEPGSLGLDPARDCRARKMLSDFSLTGFRDHGGVGEGDVVLPVGAGPRALAA